MNEIYTTIGKILIIGSPIWILFIILYLVTGG